MDTRKRPFSHDHIYSLCYSKASCMLWTHIKSELHHEREKMGSKLSQTGRNREIGHCLIHSQSYISPRPNWLIAQLSFHQMSFVEDKIVGAHGITCYAVSWSPNGAELVSGGFDNLIKIWRHTEDVWKDEVVLTGHNAWVRDVQWNPNSEKLIATCRFVPRLTICLNSFVAIWCLFSKLDFTVAMYWQSQGIGEKKGQLEQKVIVKTSGTVSNQKHQ